MLYDVDQAAIERGRAASRTVSTELVEQGPTDAPTTGRRMLDRLREAHTLERWRLEPTSSSRPRSRTWASSRRSFGRWATRRRPARSWPPTPARCRVTAIGEASGVPDRRRWACISSTRRRSCRWSRSSSATDTSSRDVVDAAVAFVDRAWARTPIVAPTRRASSSTASIGRSRSRRCGCSKRARRGWSRSTGRSSRPAIRWARSTLMDLVGIDVNLAVATALLEGFDEARPIQSVADPARSWLRSGQARPQDGRRLLRYEDGRTDRLSARLAGSRRGRMSRDGGLPTTRSSRASSWRSSTRPTTPPAREWPTPPDIDRAMKLGANHPYGPFERAGAAGPARRHRRTARLESDYRRAIPRRADCSGRSPRSDARDVYATTRTGLKSP